MLQGGHLVFGLFLPLDGFGGVGCRRSLLDLGDGPLGQLLGLFSLGGGGLRVGNVAAALKLEKGLAWSSWD